MKWYVWQILRPSTVLFPKQIYYFSVSFITLIIVIQPNDLTFVGIPLSNMWCMCEPQVSSLISLPNKPQGILQFPTSSLYINSTYRFYRFLFWHNKTLYCISIITAKF